MASVIEVVTEASSLADAMFAMSNRTAAVDRKQIILTHQLRLVTVMRDFSASPGQGDTSASYDPVVEMCSSAKKAVASANPDDDYALNRALENCDRASASIDVSTQHQVSKARDDSPSGPRGVRGALRLGGGRAGAVGVQDAGVGHGQEQLLTRLTILFPAEAVSIYPAGAAFLRSADVPQWWFALVLALAVAWIRWMATQPVGGGRPQYGAIGAAVASFLLWVVLLGDWFLPIGEPSQSTRAIAAALAFVWTWIAPGVVRQIDSASTSQTGDRA